LGYLTDFDEAEEELACVAEKKKDITVIIF